MKKIIIYIFLILCFQNSFSQRFNQLNIQGENANKSIKYPFVGGLNSPQLSSVDLNNDGKLDLFVFDRIGNVVTTFINNGTNNKIDYSLDYQYVKNFPKLKEWALLRDYNADGAMDIFSYSDESADGIAVWKGFFENKTLKFKRVFFKGLSYNIIPFFNNGKPVNLYVSGQDIPDVNDIDGDGDLDVLTFENGGGKVDWYKNMSIEEGFGKDSLLYILEDNCWGKIYESGLTVKLDLSTNSTKCANSFAPSDGGRNGLHAGSTVLTYDMDNDGDKEILLGDISFRNINLGINGGTKNAAWINAQDNVFPDPAMPINIDIFPATFMLDANNDGKKDLFAAPNNINSSEDVNNCWYYENVGTSTIPKFEFQQKDFLAGEMFDFGSNSAPTFVDFDADGLTDIVVGVGSIYKKNGDVEGRLVLIKNIGSKTVPKYKIIDDNWLNLKQFANNSFYFAPTFGDLDGDGDKDLLIGESSGGLFFVENKGGTGNPMSFDQNSLLSNLLWQKIDVGQNSVPQIVDLDRDGLQDLLIGESNGLMFFMKNIGTKSTPKFESKQKIAPNIDTLGNVILQEYKNSKGYLAPFIIDFKGKYELFCGVQFGKIFRYTDIENNLNKNFKLVNSNFGETGNGNFLNLCMDDIDADGILEMLVGNQRGGISIFKTDLKINGEPISDKNVFEMDEKIKIYPNPSHNFVNIDFEKNENISHNIQIVNVLGQNIFNQNTIEQNLQINTSSFPKGIYFVMINSKNGKKIERLIIE